MQTHNEQCLIFFKQKILICEMIKNCNAETNSHKSNH